MARTYRAKLSEMELKQTEVMRLSQDFENKMRTKEVMVCFFFILSFQSNRPKKQLLQTGKLNEMVHYGVMLFVRLNLRNEQKFLKQVTKTSLQAKHTKFTLFLSYPGQTTYS